MYHDEEIVKSLVSTGDNIVAPIVAYDMVLMIEEVTVDYVSYFPRQRCEE